jgi:GT2 family glycosyltransferase
MPSRVSVVIANWNGRHHLEACLAALDEQTRLPDEVIVVDNGSTDGSVAWLAQRYPAVTVIANAHNRGFAAANNQGLQAARGDYLALLNNDTRPEPGWLTALLVAVEAEPSVGMAASLMVFASRTELINSTGICVDRAGITWDRAGGQALASVSSQVVEVFGASAGAALYRRALFDDVGGFDETFFAYLEDVDLAWRARWRGWRAVHVPQARVYHAHSATGGQGSAFKTYWLSRNKLVLLAKNYPAPYLWWRLPLLLAYDGLSLLAALITQRNLSALRGRLAGLAALRQAWRHRRAIMRRASVPAPVIWAWLEPAEWPWRVHQTRYSHLDAIASAPPAQTRP